MFGLAPDGALKYSTYLYEITGGPRWAATLPAGDVVTMSRLQTAFEQAPNILRRYVFEVRAGRSVGLRDQRRVISCSHGDAGNDRDAIRVGHGTCGGRDSVA